MTTSNASPIPPGEDAPGGRRAPSLEPGAPGIDGVTVENFPAHARAHWPALRERIKGGRYQPQAVRRVEIPKPDGGKRMLGIPMVTS